MKTSVIKGSLLTSNILIALGLSFIVNFSYLILFIGMPDQMMSRYENVIGNPVDFLLLQLFYYALPTWLMLTIATHKKHRAESSGNWIIGRLLPCLVLAFAFYLLAPNLSQKRGLEIIFLSPRLLNPMIMLKIIFLTVASLLYGIIYRLHTQQQSIILENEKLRSENLQARYNTLVGQVNPHFLFNSLNSLSALIRENDEKSLLYIDHLSDTFRYMLQSSQNELTTLKDEMKFVEAYAYLHQIRFENKLFFNISIDSKYLSWKLPTLSLQPLIENAVKHNRITSSQPLHVSISTKGNNLIISNPIQVKTADKDSCGVGLQNISSRYKLLLNCNITITTNDNTFSVILPLTNPEVK